MIDTGNELYVCLVRMSMWTSCDFFHLFLIVFIDIFGPLVFHTEFVVSGHLRVTLGSTQLSNAPIRWKCAECGAGRGVRWRVGRGFVQCYGMSVDFGVGKDSRKIGSA